MRPPLPSRSSTKPRGSKIRACPHSDLGEFLFWRNCFRGEKIKKILIRFLKFPLVKFLKIWQRSYSLLAFLAFNFPEKFVRQGFRSAKKHKNAKNKKLPWQPLHFSIFKVSPYQTIRVLTISENFTEGNWRKLKLKPNRRQKWRCLSSCNLRPKALISEVTVEQQILALVCYVSVALIRKIAKRTRILTLDWGHWLALRDLA